MSKFRPVKFAAAIFAGIFLFSYLSGSAHGASCDPLPEVDWWAKSHSKVIKTVNRKYRGKWDSYITRWKKYRTRMVRLHESGSAAVVKSRGLRLEGKQLEEHIDDIDDRLVVLNCLKEQQLKNAKKKTLNNDNNLAGGTGQDKKDRFASLIGEKLDIEVSARCDNSTVVFQVTNLGEKWPRLGTINIYRTEGKALLVKRRLKLANSQQATFKVRDRKHKNDPVGLWLSPSWSNREFKYDAKITCS